MESPSDVGGGGYYSHSPRRIRARSGDRACMDMCANPSPYISGLWLVWSSPQNRKPSLDSRVHDGGMISKGNPQSTPLSLSYQLLMFDSFPRGRRV